MSTRRLVRAWLLYGVVALASGSLAACTHAKAKTLAELPPLDMPSPPPRVVEASDPPQSPVIALPDEQPTTLRRSAPAQRTDTPRVAEPSRTEAVPAEPSRAPGDTPRPPATTLQTTPTQREGEVERRVRILIAQAMNDLNRVNYQALNANARQQYDTAKRFAVQAEAAVQARNFVFASNLADKAAALAAQLLGR